VAEHLKFTIALAVIHAMRNTFVRCRAIRLNLLAVLLLAFSVPPLRAQGNRERASSPVYEKAKAASVEVLVNGHLNGTGWFADPQGFVVTAAHVIERPGQKVEVMSPGVGRLAAEVVAVDLGHDLALLRVPARDAAYPALSLAEKSPPPADDVFLFGAPIYRHAVLVRGTVARDNTTFEYYEDRYNEVTHISATVAIGMSGGPWLNASGVVVGLNSAVMSQNALPVGVSFSVPLPAIRALLANRKTASTPSLGIAAEELWQQDAKMIDRFPPQTEGLVIAILQNDGPAARAGLKQGEMILAADGRNVRLAEELLSVVMKKNPGQSLELSVLSPDGAGQRKVTVTLGKLEVNWP
jgi:serine protease Do